MGAIQKIYYEFCGNISKDTKAEIVDLIERSGILADPVGYGYVYVNGVQKGLVLSKEQGAILCERFLRDGLIESGDMPHVMTQIMMCPHLLDTISRVVVNDKELYGAPSMTLYLNGRRITGVMSKQYALSVVKNAVVEHVMHEQWARGIESDIMQSGLLMSVARLCRAQAVGTQEEIFVIIPDKRQGTNPLLRVRSKRQAMDQLNYAVQQELLLAGAFPRIKEEITVSELPEKHASDPSYLWAHGKDMGLFPELVH